MHKEVYYSTIKHDISLVNKFTSRLSNLAIKSVQKVQQCNQRRGSFAVMQKIQIRDMRMLRLVKYGI